MAAGVAADNAFLRAVAEPGSPLEVHDFGPPTGRGFRCARRAAEGDVLLRIPRARCVTAEVAAAEVAADRPELAALAGALPAQGAGEGPSLTAQDWLCLWLVQERRKGAASRHAAYVASLPRDCAEMSAAFWPAGCGALEALAGCSALVRLEDLRERVDAAHERVLEAIGDLWAAGEPPCGLDEYRWARCVLNSRQFGGTAIAQSAHLGVLVPGVEFANHSPAPHAAIRQSPDEAAVELVALREVAEGEEMMISYGQAGSAQLLAERGFAIEGNPDDAVDIFMEVRCDGARGKIVARCLGEDGSGVADADSRDVHLELTRRSPLPEPLLAQACLQSLGDDAVAQIAASWDGQLPLPCPAEVRRGALLQLLAVAHAMLGRFETSLQSDLHERAQPRDLTAVDARLAMAVCARLGEKEVLAATAREVVRRLLGLLEELEGRDEARTGGSVWWRLLHDSAGAVAAAQQRTVAQFQLLQTTPLGDSATTSSTLAQAASLIFMWLHDLLRHPCRQAVDGPDATARWLAWAEEAAEKNNPQLGLLFEKTAFWGAYLLAQFAVCGAFDLSAMNTMQQEALDVRRRQCCCVPSRAALRLLDRFAPLLLVGDDRAVGDGAGQWARLLRAQGTDVEEVSTDSSADALAAAVERGSSRTLVLSGPCAEPAAAACLRAYSGGALLLVGEWRGHTFGLSDAAGGSFAAPLQEGVAAAFREEASEPLPCWPLALDRVSVWRRRGAA